MSSLNFLRLGRSCSSSVQVFVLDTFRGLWAVGHHTLVLFGVAAVSTAVLLSHRDDLRQELEAQILGWLQAREIARAPATDWDSALQASLAEPQAIQRATATNPSELSRQQAAVAYWLARRYHVAPEPISRLVQEAWSVGKQAELEPTLILAVMAVESGFNPFAQSPVGAQGLMQVMTRVHDEKYEAFGGQHAAFDPVTNLRVGVEVLKECISRAGSLEGGLKFYVGAANLIDDGGYASKVLAEQTRLRDVASGKNVPVTTPLTASAIVPPVPAPTPAATRSPSPAAPAASAAADEAAPPVAMHQQSAHAQHVAVLP